MKSHLFFFILLFISTNILLQAQHLSLKTGISLDTKLSQDIIEYPYPVEYKPAYGFGVRFDIEAGLAENIMLINYFGLRFQLGSLNIPSGFDFEHNLVYNQLKYSFAYFSSGAAIKVNLLRDDDFDLTFLTGASLRIRFYAEQSRSHTPVPYQIDVNAREFDDNIFGINGLLGFQVDFNKFLVELAVEPEFLNSKIGTIGYYKKLSFVLLIEIKSWN